MSSKKAKKARAQARTKASTATRRPKKNWLREVLEVVIPAILIFLVVRTFLFETRTSPTESMMPTISVTDRYIVEKVSLHFRAPRRGEILVFRPPAGAQMQSDYVKRVIGLPGDMIAVKGGTVYINGKALSEPYVPAENRAREDFVAPARVPLEHLFMMGDNRNNSEDSRFWGFLPYRNVEARAVLRVWPISRIGAMR